MQEHTANVRSDNFDKWSETTLKFPAITPFTSTSTPRLYTKVGSMLKKGVRNWLPQEQPQEIDRPPYRMTWTN